MLFNSFIFIFGFLPATFFLFFFLARINHRAALTSLVLASLFFYGWWSTQYIWLILGSVFFNYTIGRFILRARQNARSQLMRVVLIVGIAGDLALLGYYKYANFFVQNLDALTGAGWSIPHVALPLGISFFTFTQIAFIVDTARGEAEEARFLPYALFVTYFPHLLAGPIIHHKAVMPQFQRPATFKISYENIAVGLTIFTIGLAKKVLVADSLLGLVQPVFQTGHSSGLLEAWCGTLAYTFELYFDFAGYSDMAIGLSRMFGVQLPVNFNSPYKATSIIDFWRRWHMTLSAFLRDYLYISLGGNRKGSLRRYMNLYLTMLLGGLWHGAGWTFVIWGGLHGAYLIINHAWRAVFPSMRPARAGSALAWAITFVSVVVAWVFFRAPDVATALGILSGLTGFHGLPADASGTLVPFNGGQLSTLAIAAGIAFIMPNTQQWIDGYSNGLPWRLPAWRPTARWGLVFGALLFVCVSQLRQVSEFIYYQF